MNRLLIVLILLFATTVMSCARFAEVQTYNDPIEGPTHGFVQYLDDGHYTAIGAHKAKGVYTVEVLLFQRGQNVQSVPTGTPLIFKVGEELVTLNANQEIHPVSNVHGNMVFTQWKITATPAKGEFLKLSAGALNAVRTKISGQEMTLVPKDVFATKIAENFAKVAQF